MAEFDTARSALEVARNEVRDAQQALDDARQTTARLEARYKVVSRSRRGSDPRRGRDEGEPTNSTAADISEELSRARQDEIDKRKRLDAAKAAAAERGSAFARLADPRRAITQWPDDTPVLLLPVRLETRFKTIVDDNRTREELWVRIYPDACAIDTFEQSRFRLSEQ